MIIFTYLAFNGYKNIVNILLQNDADVNAADGDGLTPLHDAAYNGHTDIVDLLIENKADINAKDIYGLTPLHWAGKNINLQSRQTAGVLLMNLRCKSCI